MFSSAAVTECRRPCCRMTRLLEASPRIAAMHPMLNTAVKAARRAGNIISRATRNLDIVAVREKAVSDLVTEVDREAERAIITTLREAYPGHAILAEESGASGASEHRWLIDPLD